MGGGVKTYSLLKQRIWHTPWAKAHGHLVGHVEQNQGRFCPWAPSPDTSKSRRPLSAAQEGPNNYLQAFSVATQSQEGQAT